MATTPIVDAPAMSRHAGRALEALAAGVVDYAGLFPPASLDMPTAVANHAQYRASRDAWMLGRFVVPVSRLIEWRAAMATLPDDAARRDWRLSALVGADVHLECGLVATCNAESPWGARIDVLEAKGGSASAIEAIAAARPDGVTCYVELPHDDDPAPLVALLARHALRAKIRTGGVTAEAFPAAHAIVRFLRRCHEAHVPCKATAGLHHPLRGEYRLTYAADAPVAPMYGWVNVVMAAGAIAHGADDATAERLLRCDDPSRLTIGDDVISLDGVALSTTMLAATRDEALVAFGSCSFREPVDELPRASV